MRGILELRQRRGEITGEKRCQSRRFCLCQRVSSNLPHTPTVAGAELTQSQFLPLNSTGQSPVSLFLSCLSYSPCLCFPRLSLSLFTWTPIKKSVLPRARTNVLMDRYIGQKKGTTVSSSHRGHFINLVKS